MQHRVKLLFLCNVTMPCFLSVAAAIFLLTQASSMSIADWFYASHCTLSLHSDPAAARTCPYLGRSVVLQPAAGFTEFSGLKNANTLRCGRQEQTLASRVATQATTVRSGMPSFTYR